MPRNSYDFDQFAEGGGHVIVNPLVDTILPLLSIDESRTPFPVNKDRLASAYGKAVVQLAVDDLRMQEAYTDEQLMGLTLFACDQAEQEMCEMARMLHPEEFNV